MSAQSRRSEELLTVASMLLALALVVGVLGLAAVGVGATAVAARLIELAIVCFLLTLVLAALEVVVG